MLLYTVRHGQSVANLKNVHAGWAQVPLTDAGCQMARETAEVYKGIHFDKIYSSDLLRSVQTAGLVINNCNPILDARLREINVGTLAGHSPADLEKELGMQYLKNRENRDFSAYGGETTSDQIARVRSFLTDMTKLKADKIAVFCHEGTIKCMLSIILGAESVIKGTNLNNCATSVFEYNADMWKLCLWNYTAHSIL